jgi:hypothetical protein
MQGSPQVTELPTRKLGAPKVPITRDEIYADLARDTTT